MGAELTDRERCRSKADAMEDLITWLTDQVGHMPAAAIFSVAGLVLGFVAYKRMERLAA